MMICPQDMATFDEVIEAYGILGIHEACASLPDMTDGVFNELCQSVNSQGMELPIVLTHDGLIIDGKHRLKACYITGQMPHFEQLDVDYADDYHKYCHRLNMVRR